MRNANDEFVYDYAMRWCDYITPSFISLNAFMTSLLMPKINKLDIR